MRIVTRQFLIALCAGAMVVAIGGCQSTGPHQPPTPPVPATTTVAPAGEPAPTAPTVATPAGEPARQWTMPNLVGMTVQQAQDSIQALTGGGIIISTSHDASGRGRNQLLDANWKVCSQNVAAGARIDGNTRIDFGAVKLSESCP